MQPLEPDPDTRARWPVYALVGLTIWFVVTVAWMARPMVDHVPTGLIDGQMTTQQVSCHDVFSSTARPAEPLPELAAPREYAREPCVGPRTQNRYLFGVDVVVAAVAAGWLGRRAMAERRSVRDAPPTEAAGGPPVAAGR